MSITKGLLRLRTAKAMLTVCLLCIHILAGPCCFGHTVPVSVPAPMPLVRDTPPPETFDTLHAPRLQEAPGTPQTAIAPSPAKPPKKIVSGANSVLLAFLAVILIILGVLIVVPSYAVILIALLEASGPALGENLMVGFLGLGVGWSMLFGASRLIVKVARTKPS